MSAAHGYGRAADVAVFTHPDGTLYVMALPDGAPRAMNGSAAVIWDIAASGSGHVLQEVAAAYGVDPDLIADDVEATLQAFVELKLIEPKVGET